MNFDAFAGIIFWTLLLHLQKCASLGSSRRHARETFISRPAAPYNKICFKMPSRVPHSSAPFADEWDSLLTFQITLAPSQPPTHLQRTQMSGAPVIFQDVVPFATTHKTRRSRSGAKVEIGCNDFQGTDLSCHLLHESVANGTQNRPVLIGTTS
jgi:hypothetical protein